MNLDTRILEVLVSRICHDLISPISAVSNGAELVADMGGVSSGADDAFDLIRSSAVAASIKLQAFRLAYGAGGSEWHVSLDDTHKIFGEYIGLEHRYKLEWNIAPNSLPQPLHRGLPKLVMLILMWGMESLPRGGVVAIANKSGADGVLSLEVSATGTGAALREGMMDAFKGHLPIDQLTPKTVHAAATSFYAHTYAVTVTVEESPDTVRFFITASA